MKQYTILAWLGLSCYNVHSYPKKHALYPGMYVSWNGGLANLSMKGCFGQFPPFLNAVRYLGTLTICRNANYHTPNNNYLLSSVDLIK